MKKARFTLVELLACMSVIALLASILLPALSKAKQMASRIECANNLKQTGTALSVYASDWQDQITPSFASDSVYRWYNLLYQVIHPDMTLSEARTWTNENPCFMTCPTHLSMHRNSGNKHTFAMNWAFASDNSTGYRYFKQLKMPSKTLLVSDGRFYESGLWFMPSVFENSYPDIVHANGVNILYADMHYNWLKFTDIPVNRSADGGIEFWGNY